jgi:hypothetical protein
MCRAVARTEALRQQGAPAGVLCQRRGTVAADGLVGGNVRVALRLGSLDLGERHRA